ncbi:MAG: LamG domain-containing protein [Candidatus Omnitrophica bacterium]|nr:LamG domain-containing protein [Candidatus Omnitrophota bacterium]
MGGLNADTKLLLHFDGADGSKEVLDDSGNGNIVTQYGTAGLTTASPQFGNTCLVLDGDSDYLTIPDSADWDFGANDFTVEWWEYRTSKTAGKETLCRHDGDSYPPFIFGGSDGTNNGVYVTSNGSSWDIVNDTDALGTIDLNTWTHLAVVRNGSDFSFYKNGIRIATASSAASIEVSASALVIGRYNSSYYFGGRIDELRVSNAARYSGISFSVPTSAFTADAQTKLLLHFETQDKSNGYHIPTFGGTAQLDTAQQKWGGASLLLDGDSDYVTFPDSADWDLLGSGSDSWTIDFWVRHANTAKSYQMYVNQCQDAGNNVWEIYHQDGRGVVLYVAIGGVLKADIGGCDITDSNWHHVALCKVADKFGVYVDGVQYAYVTFSTTATFSGNLAIGKWSFGSDYMQGWMDEIRIQHSNYFGSAPVAGLTDTIAVPAAAYGVATPKSQAILIM